MMEGDWIWLSGKNALRPSYDRDPLSIITSVSATVYRVALINNVARKFLGRDYFRE
jgi:hypothetical protein